MSCTLFIIIDYILAIKVKIRSVIMLISLNKSTNKDVKKIGEILSKIDKNYRTDINGKIKVELSRFQNHKEINSVNQIHKITIALTNEDVVEEIKNELRSLRSMLNSDTDLTIYVADLRKNNPLFY